MTLNSLLLRTTQQLLFLYISTLTGGATIDGKPVRHSTIKGYLRKAGKYLTLVGLRAVDPTRSTNKQDNWYQPIATILANVKQWESKPNQVSPVTCRMVIRMLIDLIKAMPPETQWPSSKFHSLIGVLLRCIWGNGNASGPSTSPPLPWCCTLSTMPTMPATKDTITLLVTIFTFVTATVSNFPGPPRTPAQCWILGRPFRKTATTGLFYCFPTTTATPTLTCLLPSCASSNRRADLVSLAPSR